MKDFDVKALGGAKLPEGVKITKELKRQVDGKEASIFIGTKNGEKVRYTIIDGQAKELVATNTTGKNKYTTKEEFEAELMNKYGMSSKDFAQRGIIAEYKHGKLTFTNIKSGEKISDAVLAQQESKHAQEVANAAVQAAIAKMPETTLTPLSDLGNFEVGHIVTVKKEDASKDVAQVKPQGPGRVKVARTPQKIQGKGQAPTSQVKKAIVDRQPAYLTEAEAKKRGLGAVDNHGTFLLNGGNEVKPQGNDKGGIQQDTIYYATKVGNKTIYIKSSVSDKEKAAIIKAEEDRQKANETKYNTNFTTGKTFAQKLSANSGRGILEIKDADLKEATKDLTPQYFKGFLKGMHSNRSINGSRSQFMNGVYYSKAASPQAKKDFALKMLNSAKGWNSKATCEINGKKYSYDSLIKEIKANGLTEETAKAAGMLFNQIKLA